MPSTVLLQASAAGMMLLFMFLVLIVFLAMVVWTYQDAKHNSTHPPFLWAIVVLFAPVLGIVLYLLVGRDAMGPAGGATHRTDRY